MLPTDPTDPPDPRYRDTDKTDPIVYPTQTDPKIAASNRWIQILLLVMLGCFAAIGIVNIAMMIDARVLGAHQEQVVAPPAPGAAN